LAADDGEEDEEREEDGRHSGDGRSALQRGRSVQDRPPRGAGPPRGRPLRRGDDRSTPTRHGHRSPRSGTLVPTVYATEGVMGAPAVSDVTRSWPGSGRVGPAVAGRSAARRTVTPMGRLGARHGEGRFGARLQCRT
jgi:hypothetical protein